MKNFTFASTPKIMVELHGAGRIGEHAKDLLGERTLVVTDPEMVRLGIIDPLMSSLSAAGIGAAVFDAVIPEPPARVVREAADLARTENLSSVLGFGGGSSLDVAKLVALLAKTPQELESIYGVGLVTGARLPLLLVPTTAGTGSEVTPVAVVTSDEDVKSPVVAPQLLPDAALLDGALTISLPPDITAATGVDAMVHALEAYTSGVRKNPISDVLAKQALRLLAKNIEVVVQDGSDVEARANMLLGSMLAGQAFANSSVGAVHALAYPLGGRFHVCHGLSNALVLPGVMKVNLPDAAALYADIARALQIEDEERNDVRAAEALIQYFSRLVRRLNLKSSLRDVGVKAEDIPMLVNEGLAQTRLLSYNIKKLDKPHVEQVYRDAL